MTPEQLAPLVRATVVDLESPAQPLAESYLVDTNVLYFCYYQRHSQHEDLDRGPAHYQIRAYPNYEKRIRAGQRRLGVTRTIPVEFLHRIEAAELTILHAVLDPNIIGRDPGFPIKAVREMGHLAGRLDEVREQVQTHLAVLQARITLLPDPTWATPFVECLQEEWRGALIDATDAVFIAEAKAAGIPNIISDDAELSTVPGIQLCTANRIAIRAARQAGRLA